MHTVRNERGRKEKKQNHKSRGAGIKLSVLLCIVILACLAGCVSYLMHVRELEREITYRIYGAHRETGI